MYRITHHRLVLLCALAATSLAAAQDTMPDLTDTTVHNPSAYIPSQCYTKTEDSSGQVFNPCYVCHTRGRIPNYLDDSDLQGSYALPGPALENPWRNLFVDRTAQVAAQSDADILAYVRSDNYRSADGSVILAQRLGGVLPKEWDLQGDGHWDGFTPDAWFQFDTDGFDRTPDGGYSGWRAFAYTPFPGTFWPTNGSTDDVLIRLAASFREDAEGHFDPELYRLNLAIVESLVKRADVAIAPVDERRCGVDLDKDGRLAKADHIAYDWAPLEQRHMSYVGRAKALLEAGELHLAAGLLPEGSEFLHSVRYLDPLDEGGIGLTARMKELRYARKTAWYNYSELRGVVIRAGRERALDPDALESVPGDFEHGLFTQGWVYQGFIEDRSGDLRPQSQEETLWCMGCHGGIGAITDTLFSFPRKLDAGIAYRRGWYHWSQRSLAGTPEPRRPDGRPEYAHYLKINGAGDELRANDEVRERFFDPSGALRPERLQALEADISTLLWPSRERALRLDKAYRLIVRGQTFTSGRDAIQVPPQNVHRSVRQGQPTGVQSPEP